VLQILVGFVLAGMALLVAQWQRIPDIHGSVDPLWRLNLAIGWLPTAVMIGTAINALRISGALHGDFLRKSGVSRLVASIRVWWIVSLISAGLVVLALFIGLLSSGTGGRISAGDLFQFAPSLLTAAFGSVLYFNVRHMLLRWPDELMRMWQSGQMRYRS
jgi:hypothetical protein